MLTAKSDTVDVVLGLESGADDYVVKPFKRRNWWPGSGPGCGAPRNRRPSSWRSAEVSIDVPGHQVLRDGEYVSLTRWSSTCSSRWPASPGRCSPGEVLLEQVWGYRHAADTRLVNVHVQRCGPRSSGIRSGRRWC